MKKVQILLSTYNGEQFLSTQLDSLLAQSYQNLDILIRDDGSTDGTIGLLQEYAQCHSNITYFSGENLGPQGSFFELMKAADLSSDYFAFCDQDDYWKEEKVRAAVETLESLNSSQGTEPSLLLYCGKPTLVDSQLNSLPTSIVCKNKTPGFGNALIENICYGCTTVINRELLQFANQYTPSHALMHDWWLYLLASCWGTVVYDSQSYLLYRQYEGNQVGTKGTYFSEFKYRLGLWKKRVWRFSKQAEDFSKFARALGKPLPAQQKKLLTLFLEYPHSAKARMAILGCKEIYRQRPEDTIAIKLCLLLGIL